MFYDSDYPIVTKGGCTKKLNSRTHSSQFAKPVLPSKHGILSSNLNGLDFDSKSSIEMSIYSHKVQQLKANSSIGMEFDSSLERSSRNPEFEVYASKYSYRALVSQQDHSLTKLQQINQKYSKSNLKS